MKKLALAVALVAMLASDASAVIRQRTVFVNRGFRNHNVVVVNRGFGVRNFGVFVAPSPIVLQPQFVNQGFVTQGFVGGGFNTFAVPVSPFGFQTFQTFGCH